MLIVIISTVESVGPWWIVPSCQMFFVYFACFVGVTAIEAEWIPKYAPLRCKFSEPLETPPPRYDGSSGVIKCHMTTTFGNYDYK